MREGRPGVHDVFNDYDVESLDVGVKIFSDLHDPAARALAAIGADLDEVEGRAGAIDRPSEIAQEVERAFQDSDEDRVFASEVAVDIERHLADSRLEGRLIDQGDKLGRMRIHGAWTL